MRLSKAISVYTMLVVYCKTAHVTSEDPDVENLQKVGAEYLQNVMNQLQSERSEGQSVDMMELASLINTERSSDPGGKGKQSTSSPGFVITGPTPLPPVEAEISPNVPPPPALSTDELSAIYQAAVTKGATLPHLQAATQQISSFHHPPPPPPTDGVKPAAQGVTGDSLPGYYYYFYPIKSFTKPPEATPPPPPPTAKPPVPMQVIHMMETPNRGMEPLFMAISGFIGMALMFIFSVLFLPKFGKFRSGDLSKLKEAPDELAAFGRLVIETLDGKDCSERLACEVGRVLRKMRMDNKPLKILEILLPPNLAKQISQVRKAAARKEKCNFIPCKYKTSRPPAKSNKIKKSQTAHEMWMKHFENNKLSLKQPENIWHHDNS